MKSREEESVLSMQHPQYLYVKRVGKKDLYSFTTLTWIKLNERLKECLSEILILSNK